MITPTSRPAVELLAPAGSRESLEAAVAAGADAVYMGGQRFGARAYAQNPDDSGVLSAIDYVHLHGKRLYLTVNTLLKESEISGQLVEWLAPLYEHGLDAVLVQDLGVMAVLRRHFPGMELHISTQMAVGAPFGARAAKELGASRLVLPRELSLTEIRAIHEESDIELEAFIHGALCYCTSGQCLLSSMIGGRSGNRGRCAQPCRLPYNGSHLLNLKDLCTLDILPQIVEAGVTSLKIEGRMKSPRYTAGVVSVYRKYLDRVLAGETAHWKAAEEDRELLRMLFDRGGFSDGYYRRHNGAQMIFTGEKPKQRDMDEARLAVIDERFCRGGLTEPIEGTVVIAPGEPAVMEAACRGVRVRCVGPAAAEAKSRPLTREEAEARFRKTGGTPFVFDELAVSVADGAFLPVGAMNALRRETLEALEQQICAAYRRKYAAPAETEAAKCPETENANHSEAETVPARKPEAVLPRESGPEVWASVEDLSLLESLLSVKGLAGVYLPLDRMEPEDWAAVCRRVHGAGKGAVLAFPHMLRGEMAAYLASHEDALREAGFDGLLLRSLDEVRLVQERELAGARIFDAGLYTWNREAVRQMKALGADVLTLPVELRREELLARGLEESDELIIYGRLPVMTSAQCTAKTTGHCRRAEIPSEHRRNTEAGFRMLTDRTKASFLEDSRCRFCYTVIYNSVPLWLCDRVPADVGRVRLAFTDETPEEAERILRRVLAGETAPPERFTRGHFARGVE